MKLIDLINFPKFYNLVKHDTLSFKLAYKLSALNKKAEETISFYQEQINKILNDFAERDSEGNYVLTEDGDGVKIQQEHRALCNSLLNDLQNMPIEDVSIFFTFEELENLNITPENISPIIPFIK